MHKPLLLLTATINCDGTPFVKRQNPQVREADYMWAIKGWMETEGYETFVFCENSGASLAKLEKYAVSLNRFKHRLIFLSCNRTNGSRDRGKGYGEMEIIKNAIEAMPALSSDQLVVKATGRYRARDGTRLLGKLGQAGGDIFCTLWTNLTRADSRLFAIRMWCAREQLLSRHDLINETQHKHFEHVLADAVHGTILAGGGWSLLPCDPLLYGVSGTYGIRFGFSPFSFIRPTLRHLVARSVY
jgi:hypothetical protein